MRVRKIVIILGLLGWALDAGAQDSSGVLSMSEQWQLTVDVIKAKAQTLVIKNNALQAEYRQLMEQKQELEQALKDEQDKIETMRRFLQERHGRTDQQVQLEQLKQAVKIKKRRERDFREQLVQLKREHKNFSAADTAAFVSDGQLTDLRRQLEEEKQQEVMLGNELSSLKSGGPPQNLDKDSAMLTLPWPLKKKELIQEMAQVDANNNQLRQKIKMLRAEVDVLRDQVAKLESRVHFIQGKDKTQF